MSYQRERDEFIHVTQAFRRESKPIVADLPCTDMQLNDARFERDAQAIMEWLSSAIPSGTADRLFAMIREEVSK